MRFYFDSFGTKNSIEEDIIYAYEYGIEYNEEIGSNNINQYFLLGTVNYDNYDGWNLYYNNENKKILIYDYDAKEKIEIKESLFQIIDEMTGV